MSQALFFDHVLLPEGWARDVRIEIERGWISAIKSGQQVQASDDRHACGIPGMPNLHSHAFQRGMAGLTERRGRTADSFWTWRDLMYRFVSQMTPDDLEAVATLAYVEMLESGFTRVGEFHYLHHDLGGRPFANPAEMCAAIVRAADRTGIGLTLLPVLYSYAGFGALPPSVAQARFINDVEDFARIVEAADLVAKSLPDAIVGIAPHSLRAVAPEQFLELSAISSERPIHIHIAEQVQEVEDCLKWSGQRPVAWLLDNCDVDPSWCLVHATHVVPEEVARLAASGGIAGLCPITEANLGDGVFPADRFMSAGGQYGVGSDSNVLINAAEELRLLEYGQRLMLRSRNVLAIGSELSTGLEMYQATIRGGAMALGIEAGLVVGAAADIVSLDMCHPAFAAVSEASLIDSYVFAASNGAIDAVWRHGRRVVRHGRHELRAEVVQRYQVVLAKLLN
jgi:formimidoylglutamate deiminase